MKVEELRAKINELPRVKLATIPTPLEEARRLSRTLNELRLWVKRDDLTGLALGGNKVRKLDFVMADALRKGSDVVIATGSPLANSVRVIAAAARKLGMDVVLVLYGRKPAQYDGNVLLEHLLGAEIRFFDVKEEEAPSVMNEVAKELRERGRNPYVIPPGLASPLGAVAYVEAAVETLAQASERGVSFDYVVHAAGSGATQAGLSLGLKALGAKAKAVGISVDWEKKKLASETARLANECSKLLGLDVFVSEGEVMIFDEYVGEGYGRPSIGTIEAIKLAAETEGLLLDPVYTGVAMNGLVELTRRGYFRGSEVVFLHTGGTPLIFEYKRVFQPTAT